MYGANRARGRRQQQPNPMYRTGPVPRQGATPGRWRKKRSRRPNYGGYRPFMFSELPPAASVTLHHRYGPGSRW